MVRDSPTATGGDTLGGRAAAVLRGTTVVCCVACGVRARVVTRPRLILAVCKAAGRRGAACVAVPAAPVQAGRVASAAPPLITGLAVLAAPPSVALIVSAVTCPVPVRVIISAAPRPSVALPAAPRLPLAAVAWVLAWPRSAVAVVSEGIVSKAVIRNVGPVPAVPHGACVA